MKKKKLVIISHTEHYIDANGAVRGLGSTVNEINFLSDYWEEVFHVGCLHEGDSPASFVSYISPNIKFVAIPPYGGNRIIDKVMILIKMPKIIFEVIKATKNASEVQLRLPTSMGLFLLPLFSFFIPRRFTFWVKYAGNWKQEHAPLSYRIQRWWLTNNWANCKVTINGFWDNQPKHCYSFENPCLTIDDISEGMEIANNKNFKAPFIFCFVGRLEVSKGVDRIVEALKAIPLEKIAEVHFVGSGPLEDKYKGEASFLGDKVIFHRLLPKEKVHGLLKISHFLLLPSYSEGFPKVIAEGACYGVIPIVSNVGSIPHYINFSNGFLWDIKEGVSFGNVLKDAVHMNSDNLKVKSQQVITLAEKFTFANYKNKLISFLSE